MAVAISYTPVPDAPTRVVKPGDIQLGEVDAATVPLNRGGDILTINAARRSITFNVEGLSAPEIAALDNTKDSNLLNLLNGGTPSLKSISFSGLLFDRCYLKSINPSGQITVAGVGVVEKTAIVYETFDRYLV